MSGGQVGRVPLLPGQAPLHDANIAEFSIPGETGAMASEGAVRRMPAEASGIGRMHLDQRLATVLGQRGAQPGAGHRVPLIAVAAGVEPQRKVRTALRRLWRRKGNQHHLR